MKLYTELKRSVRSLLLHRLRSGLSTLGIMFGIVALIAMLSIGEGAKQDTLEQIEQLGMKNIMIRNHTLSQDQNNEGIEHESRTLTWDDAQTLGHDIPAILHVAPLKVIHAPISGSSQKISPEILAANRSFQAIKGLQLSEGRFLCDLDQNERKLVCVLGYEVARSLGPNGHVGQTILIGNQYYEIVGVLNSTDWKKSKNQSITARNFDQTLFIPLQIANQMGPYHLSEIILQVTDGESIETTAQVVKTLLKKLHEGDEHYQIIVPKELLKQASRTQHTFNLVLGSIAGISLLVGGIGIMNIMLANVSDRTREIGIRRSVGASKQHILTQFLFEALVLTLGGASLGIIIGIGFSTAISIAAGWRTIVTLWSIVLALSMSIGVGLCSGLYPACHAANMDPIKALRDNH